jgi:succinoglycan biosynthesis transport protein ExoP
MRDPFQDDDFVLEARGSAALASTLEFVRHFIRRRWRLMAFTTLTGIALAVAGLKLVPPKYNATATILIDKQRLNFFRESVVGDLSIESNAAIEGQVEVLKSDVIAHRVIEQLNLESDADFAMPKPWFGITDALGIAHAAPPRQANRTTFLLETFAKNRTIRRLGASFAIEIGFQSHSAELAAKVANAIADTYMSDVMTARRDAARDAGEWLQERLKGLRAQVAEADAAVVALKRNSAIVDAGGKQITALEVAEISSQLTSARSRLSEVNARLDRARAVAQEYATSEVAPAMTETLSSPLATKLQEQYLELSNRVAEYARRFGHWHEATLKLRQRAQEVRRNLVQDIQRLSQSFLSEKAILEERVHDLEVSLKTAIEKAHDAEQAQVKLRELESIALSYRTLHEGLLNRHTEAVLQQQQPITGARIISMASEPSGKNLKKPLIYAAALAFGSLGLGVGLSLLEDIRDRTFRSRGDIELKLKSDFIGMVPTWTANRRALSFAGQTMLAVEGLTPDRQIRRSNSALWGVTLSPASAFAEAIGSATFAILRNAARKDGRIIGFTSVLPNEGASTVAAAVVQSLAKTGRSVILVDWDLRHPELTRALAPHAKVGLQEVMLGHANLEQAILSDAQTGFAFLPGVITRLAARPEQLLESEALAAVLRELRKRYAYVIVDLPPMFPMLDVSMTDRLIESYVIVVQWGASKIDTVSHALARCQAVHNRMLGLVLNKVDMNRLSLYDQSTAEYYDAARYSNYLLLDAGSDRAGQHSAPVRG